MFRRDPYTRSSRALGIFRRAHDELVRANEELEVEALALRDAADDLLAEAAFAELVMGENASVINHLEEFLPTV